MPHISLTMTWLAMLLAAYTSFVEEEVGEDGLELESSDDDAASQVLFRLQPFDSDQKTAHPKYSICNKWKWFQVFFQFSAVVQFSVFLIWFYEFVEVEELDDTSDLEGGDFKGPLEDYNLHVLPSVVLVVEYLTNALPFMDRHYACVILPFLFSQLFITVLLELYFDIKLYMIDISHLPMYNISMLVLSVPIFYFLKMISWAKIKIQGYPCSKILEEVEEYFENEKKQQRETEMLVKEPPFERSEYVPSKKVKLKKDLSAIKEEQSAMSSPIKNGTD